MTAGIATTIDGLVVEPDAIDAAKHRVAVSSLNPKDKDDFAAFAETYAQRPDMLVGKTVRTIINQQKSYEVGVRMAEQAREQDEKHERLMATLITPTVPSYSESGRSIHMLFTLRNKSSKVIKSFIAAIEIHDKATGKRIGLAELRITRTVPARSSLTFAYPMRYVRFGEDAGTMRLAQGKRKAIALDFETITYADGQSVGGDD
ncbi:MAG: hypothetical protein M3Y21_06915 [Candidatus Eremiobacteraeota bacterium]|nr:hypothetical protein [Candidatus Eremiobacteraeota bacterium]